MKRRRHGPVYDIASDASLNRRISGIEFNTDGSFRGLNSPTETSSFLIRYDANPLPQEITLNLGTEGSFTGLTQFSEAKLDRRGPDPKRVCAAVRCRCRIV